MLDLTWFSPVHNAIGVKRGGVLRQWRDNERTAKVQQLCCLTHHPCSSSYCSGAAPRPMTEHVDAGGLQQGNNLCSSSPSTGENSVAEIFSALSEFLLCSAYNQITFQFHAVTNFGMKEIPNAKWKSSEAGPERVPVCVLNIWMFLV